MKFVLGIVTNGILFEYFLFPNNGNTTERDTKWMEFFSFRSIFAQITFLALFNRISKVFSRNNLLKILDTVRNQMKSLEVKYIFLKSKNNHK
jgi:hypothetical protein